MPEIKTRKRPGQPKKTVENCMPENWDKIILEKSAEGCSDVEIRAHLCMLGGKFSHETWYALIEREIAFSETIKKGKILCQAWWERVSREHLYHTKEMNFETGSWYANMKNRFGWHDKQEIKHSGEITMKQVAENVNNARRAGLSGMAEVSNN